jgi:hypothetical protein
VKFSINKLSVINKKGNLIIIFVFLLLFFGGFGLAWAENKSENVKNTVSATANSGGNIISGSGTIKTGDAKATVEAKNYVNGGENVENRAEAKAEGNEASVSVNGEEKNCTAEKRESCQVELDSTFASVGENVAEPEKEAVNDKAEDKTGNFFVELAKSLMNKIGEWLS